MRSRPQRQHAVRAMPFQTAQDMQIQRRSIGMWLGSSGSWPYPAPQLQHVSRSSSLETPHSRQDQLWRVTVKVRTWWAIEPAAVVIAEPIAKSRA